MQSHLSDLWFHIISLVLSDYSTYCLLHVKRVEGTFVPQTSDQLVGLLDPVWFLNPLQNYVSRPKNESPLLGHKVYMWAERQSQGWHPDVANSSVLPQHHPYPHVATMQEEKMNGLVKQEFPIYTSIIDPPSCKKKQNIAMFSLPWQSLTLKVPLEMAK